ncbi:transposase [Streptomyces sp. NPDC004227]
MARRARKRRLELEAEYWRLLAAGVGTVEACKQLGIGRKTGYRWRAENGGLQPDYLPERSRSGRYLSLLERRRIASLRERGLTIREIAARLGRAPSTVSRELRRNSRPHDNGVYDADLAHHRCRERAGRPRRAELAVDPELRAEVQAKLDQTASSDQSAPRRWPRVGGERRRYSPRRRTPRQGEPERVCGT